MASLKSILYIVLVFNIYLLLLNKAERRSFGQYKVQFPYQDNPTSMCNDIMIASHQYNQLQHLETNKLNCSILIPIP